MVAREYINQIYQHRLHNLRIMAKLLQLVPFLKCVVLTGSMAEDFPLCHPERPEGVEGSISGSRIKCGMTRTSDSSPAVQNDRKKWKMKQSSDIDLLVIAKSGRVFTCRAAVLFWAYLSGLKRSSNERRNHAGKFCFNYFLTDKFLMIPHNRGEKIDRYCAENYSKSLLVWGDRKLFEKYIAINLKWMKKFLSQTSNPSTSSGQALKPQTYNSKLKTPNSHCEESGSLDYSGRAPQSDVSVIPSEVEGSSINRLPRPDGLAMTDSNTLVQKSIEKILASKFGDRIEKIFKKIQVRKIKKDPKLTKQKNLVVFNDKELRFHPPKN